jgi:urease accessory protein UreF
MKAQADTQLQLLFDQLALMYDALASLRQDVYPKNPALYRVMAEGPLDEIRKLQEAIDARAGVTEAREESADLWLRITGSGIDVDDAPTSVLTAILDAFRKGVQSVAEFLDKGTLSARPTQELKNAADLRIVAFASGSLQVGLKLPPAEQQSTLADLGRPLRDVVEEALREYVAVAEWAASGTGDLAARIPDNHRRRVLLNAVKPILPRKRGSVSLVELRGRLTGQPQPVRLGRDTHERLDTALDHLVTTKPETHRGVLREIDLDAQTFQLRRVDDAVVIVKCSFADELFEVAKEALDRLVEVTGTRVVAEGRRTASTLDVARLEIVEDDAASLQE